jgi:hypothetical protein
MKERPNVVLALLLILGLGATGTTAAVARAAGGAVLTVNSTRTTTTCTNRSILTLPCAIIRANADGSGDTIKFAIRASPTGCAVQVIQR